MTIDRTITECTDIQIIEESCGRTVRICDPAEFGIVVKKREPVRHRPDQPQKTVPWSAQTPRRPIVITEESCGKTVRIVDIAEINAIVKRQFNLG